jgi:hypothetical protein
MRKGVAVLAATAARADPRRDGNWWIVQDDTGKFAFVVGVSNGVTLGSRYAMGDGPPNAAFTGAYNLYLAGWNDKQIKAALDAFYADPANRLVRLDDAVRIALKQLAGDVDVAAAIAAARTAGAAQ